MKSNSISKKIPVCNYVIVQVNSTSYLAEVGDYEQQPGTKQKGYEDEIELGTCTGGRRQFLGVLWDPDLVSIRIWTQEKASFRIRTKGPGSETLH